MLNRYIPPLGSIPKLWLAVSASLIGVCIGLIATDLKRQNQLDRQMNQLLAEFSNLPSRVSNLSSFFGTDASKSVTGPHLENRINLLLLGVDSNGRRTQRFANTRSDTIIVASLDPNKKTVGLISIPRDSRVRIAQGHGMDKINAAHALGGPALTIQTIEEDFGIAIDHYIVIDVQGLKKLFQILGPADVLVEKKMHYTDHAAGLRVALEPGLQTLSPLQMEEYVRFRHDQKGDLGRIERQQWFLRQVTQKLQEPQVVLKLPELFNLANEYVMTDLSVQDMAKLATFGKELKAGDVKTATLPGKASFVHGGSYFIPEAYGSAVVFNRLLGTNLTAVSTARGLRLSDLPDETDSDEAIAASINNDYNVNSRANLVSNDIAIVTIKYARGCEPAARKLEKALTRAGYKIKYVMRGDLADCAHELVQQTSLRADDEMTMKLLAAVPVLKAFPVSIDLHQKTAQDFIVVISPAISAKITAN